MSKATPRDKRLFVLKKMPELYHKIDDKYDPRKSEVLKWATEQPEILNYLFDKLRTSKLIEYDEDTGKWHGIDNKSILKGA